MSRPAFLLALGLLVLARTVHAGEEAPRFVRAPHGVVHPGDVIELEWAVEGGDVDELEVVLAVDEGQRFTVRVTPELEPTTHRWSWTVPDLPSAHARLAIRYGEEDEEKISLPTNEFRIEPRAAEASAPRVARVWISRPGLSADWWDEADAPPVRGAEQLAGGETLAPCDAPARSATLPRRSNDVDARPDRSSTPLHEEAAAAPVITSQRTAAEPRFIPLRN